MDERIVENSNQIITKFGEKIKGHDEQFNTIEQDFNSQLEQNAKYITEMINVKNFGVVGDGITDNTEKIQELLNTYQSLYFPRGVYILRQLILNSFNKLEGEGISSELKQKDNTNANFIILKDDIVHSVHLNNLFVNGNKENQTTENNGIYFRNSLQEIQYNNLIDHYFVMNNVNVENCKGDGIRLEYCREVKFNNVIVRKCNKNGIFFNGSDSCFSNCTVSTCDVGYNFFTGGSRVSNCKAFVNKVGFWFNSEYCSNMAISSSDTQSNKIGYKLTNCKNIVLENIIADGEEDRAIVLENAKSCFIKAIINENFNEVNSKGLFIYGKTQNCKINILTNSNKMNSFIDKLFIEKCFPSNEIIINNENILQNIFKYDIVESKKLNKINSLSVGASSGIVYTTEFKNNKLVIKILSNEIINNWSAINLETEFIDIPSNFNIGACANMIIENGQNITPSISFICNNGVDDLGKIPEYITDINSNSIAENSITENQLLSGTKKVKIAFGFETKQNVGLNELTGYIFSISNISISIL